MSADDERRDWLAVRAQLGRHRYDLALRAFADAGGPAAVAGAPLLVRPEWLPGRPIPLPDVRLDHRPDPAFAGLTGTEDAFRSVLPPRADGTRHRRYSDAVVELGAGGRFRNLATYRLLAADLAGDVPRLTLGDGHYFDGLDVGEACAHEYAQPGPLAPDGPRAAVGDPTDLTRRPANVAVSALTLRHDRATGAVTMPLHRRDPARVGHAGGMIQVLPVGVFQPTGPEPWNVAADLSLWRLLLREYAEELLGAPEDHDTAAGPFDYAGWEFGARMGRALRERRLRPYVLGLGVDPLTYATDLLPAVVLDAGTYDDLFRHTVAENTEGTVLADIPFTAATVERYAAHEPTQAAGAALLRLAWSHRATLLA